MKGMTCPLSRNARNFPQRSALRDDTQRLNYSQLDNCVENCRINLSKYDIRANERVAVLAERSLEQLVVLYSLWRQRSVGVILNTYQPMDVLRSQMRQLGVKKIITDKKFKTFHAPGIRTLQLESLVNFKTAGNPARTSHHFKSNQPAVILFTSGTTGKPKAAQLTFANLFTNAVGANAHIKLGKNDRWLLSLPLYHVGGLGIFFRTLQAGATLALGKFKTTHMSLVPAQLTKLMANKKTVAQLKKMKCVLIGGSRLPQEMLKHAVNLKLPIYASYGLTEMASQVAVTRQITAKNINDLQVVVLKQRQVKISREGEILVRGPMLFSGYIINNKLVPSRTKDGWFNTRDLGTLQGKLLRVHGRADNLIISGGENIQPEEIEDLLQTSNIRRSCVIAKEDRIFSQRPIAFIETHSAKGANKKMLIHQLQQRVARYKIPDEWYYWPKEISSQLLKTSRRELQQFYNLQKDKLKPLD